MSLFPRPTGRNGISGLTDAPKEAYHELSRRRDKIVDTTVGQSPDTKQTVPDPPESAGNEVTSGEYATQRLLQNPRRDQDQDQEPEMPLPQD